MYVILRYPQKQLQTRVGAVKSQVMRLKSQVRSQVFDVKSRVITGKCQASRKVSKTPTRVGLESQVPYSSLQLWYAVLKVGEWRQRSAECWKPDSIS